MAEDLSAHTDAKLSTVERRGAILQQVQRDYRVRVTKLSQRFGVSTVTIRRDLDNLERMGLLERMHGGAIALSLAARNFRFDARLLQNTDVKRAIGRAAAKLIRPGEIVLLDSGTTVLEVARHIPTPLLEDGGLTVITRSLSIAWELRKHRNTRLMILGGVYVHDFDTIIGYQVENALREMKVDALFAGTDGVTADLGLSTDNVVEAGLYPIMARCADRVLVVTDSSKIGVHQLQVFLSLDEIDIFVTDTEAPADFVNRLREQNIDVILVPKA